MPGISRRDMARYSWEQAGHPLIGTDNLYLALALKSFAVMKASCWCCLRSDINVVTRDASQWYSQISPVVKTMH